jgi:hypothetical protein
LSHALENLEDYGVGYWPLKARPHISGPNHALNRWGLPICGYRSPINQNITIMVDADISKVNCSVCLKQDDRLYRAYMNRVKGNRPWWASGAGG